MDIILAIVGIILFWSFFGELVLDLLGGLLDILAAIAEWLEDVFYFFRDTKDKVKDKVQDTKDKAAAADAQKRRDELRAKYHDFTDPDVLPRDHILLREMYTAYLRESDDQRALICMELAAKAGSKQADYDAAKYLLEHAATPEEQLTAVRHAQNAVTIGAPGAKKLQEQVLKAFSFKIAKYCLSQENYKDAETYFNIAAQQGFHGAYTYMAKLIGIRAKNSDEWLEAENWAELAVKHEVAESDLLDNCRKNRLAVQGLEYEKQEQFDEAIDCYIEAAQLQHHKAAARGAALLEHHAVSMEDWKMATSLAQQAVRNDTLSHEEYVSITMKALLIMTESDEAYKEAFDAVEQDNMELAAALWEKSAEMGHSGAAYNLAILLSNNHQFEEAERYARKAWELERRDRHLDGLETFLKKARADNLFFKGAEAYNAYKDSNDKEHMDAAVALWEESAELDNPLAVSMLASTLPRTAKTADEFRKAKFWTKKAVDNGEENLKRNLPLIEKMLEYRSGEEAQERGDYRKAAEHFRQVNRISPDPRAAATALMLYIDYVASTPEDWDTADTLVDLTSVPPEEKEQFHTLIKTMRSANEATLKRLRKELQGN